MARRDPNFPMQGKRGGMGGTYGSKSTNLSKKQLKAAGAEKAAGKRTVSISDTKRVGSRTMGPGGKPLTGTVTLQDGSKAVYKDGRRVQAADARKPKPASSGGSRSSRPSRPSTGQAGSSSGGSQGRPGSSGGSRPNRAATSATVSGAVAAGRRAGAGSGRTGSYTPGAGTGSRSATSATVSGAVASGNRQGPTDNRTGAQRTYDAARAALAEWQKKKLVTPADMAKERAKRKAVADALARLRASR